MPLSHAIAHHLRRHLDSAATLSLRQDELATDGYSDTLLNQLKSAFLGRISREHGSFSAEAAPSVLAQELEAFLDGQHSLAQLSATFMERLRQQVDEKGIEIDVHFLFFVEKSFDHHVFYLFGAKRQESLAINEALEIAPSYSVDTGHSLFGIKVDLAEWKERQNYAYLTLIAPRGNPALAEAFHELTGFHGGLDKTEATQAFLDGVETFARQIPEEKANELRSQVVGYCIEQDEQDAPVDFRELARTLDGIDGDEFVRVVSSHNPHGTQEMMMDRRSLRRYVKFAGREKDLAISFSSHQLHGRVRYDADSDTLSIIGIPRALRNQLLGHLKGD